jgi:hypothetical protein
MTSNTVPVPGLDPGISTVSPKAGFGISDRRTSISMVGRIARLSPKPTTCRAAS